MSSSYHMKWKISVKAKCSSNIHTEEKVSFFFLQFLLLKVCESFFFRQSKKGNKGFHLNPTDTSRLAKNLLSSVKSFWKVKEYLRIINDNNIEPEHPLVFDSEMPTLTNNSEDQPNNRNLKALTNIRLKNRNRPIIGQLNINSIWNKFDFLSSKIIPDLNLYLSHKRNLMIHFQRLSY